MGAGIPAVHPHPTAALLARVCCAPAASATSEALRLQTLCDFRGFAATSPQHCFTMLLHGLLTALCRAVLCCAGAAVLGRPPKALSALPSEVGGRGGGPGQAFWGRVCWHLH